MSSKLVGTSSSTRTLDERDLASLRPAVSRKSRRGAADKRHLTMAVELGLFCPAHPGERFVTELEGFKHVAGCLWRALQQVSGGEDGAAQAMQKLPRAATLPAEMLTDLIAWREGLSDEDCRSAASTCARLRSKKLPVPDELRLMAAEYKRRGIRLSPEERARRYQVMGRELGPAARDGDPAERERIIPPLDRRRDLRLALGLSQAALAKKIGTCQGAVGAWENGRNLPKLPLARRYAKALGWKP